MNIFEKMIEKIKQIFNKPQPKLLGDGSNKQQQPFKQNKKGLENIKVTIPQNMKANLIKEFETGSLNDAIDQYLKAIAYNYINGYKIDSYNVLTGLFAKTNQPQGNNLLNENQLIENIRNHPNKYILNIQGKENPYFYHIKSSRIQDYNSKDTVRFYINVKRENISNLANELIKEFKDEPFYIKFLADNQLNNRARTESIVIYEKNDRVNRTLQIIEKLKREKPEIFSESEKMGNPFCKKICDGVVNYAEDVDGNYIDSYGNNRSVPPSYNSELSVALGEAYINAAYSMIKNKKNISKGMDYNFVQNMDVLKNVTYIDNKDSFSNRVNQTLDVYAYAYEYLEKNNNYELVQTVKQNLLKILEKNPKIQVNSIDNIKKIEER